MIDALFVDLENIVGTDRACRLTGRPKATHYRRRAGPRHGPRKPSPAPSNALTATERDRVLALLRGPRFRDLAVAQVWAMLLDEGIYLCSQATMHRLLREAGENRDRRRQRTHPAKVKPHLVANDICQVWSHGSQSPTSWFVEANDSPVRRRGRLPPRTALGRPSVTSLPAGGGLSAGWTG